MANVVTYGWANHGEGCETTDLRVVAWTGEATLDGTVFLNPSDKSHTFLISVTSRNWTVHKPESLGNAMIELNRPDAICLRNALTAYIEMGLYSNDTDK